MLLFWVISRDFLKLVTWCFLGCWVGFKLSSRPLVENKLCAISAGAALCPVVTFMVAKPAQYLWDLKCDAVLWKWVYPRMGQCQVTGGRQGFVEIKR